MLKLYALDKCKRGEIVLFDLVDIHCHTLFSVDDGATDENTMKSMLDTAYSDGIRAICFTPHFKTYEFDDDSEFEDYRKRIDDSFSVADLYVKEKYPDMTLYLGNEIMYHNEILDSLKAKNCTSLNGSSYALVEFQPSTSAFEIEAAILRILRTGYRPIIAHIERYNALIKKPSLVSELRNMGALMQVNARAILRFKFGKISKFIKQVLKNKQVDIVASDAHDNTVFTQQLSKSMLFVSKRYGESYAKKIFSTVPKAILNNEKIH